MQFLHFEIVNPSKNHHFGSLTLILIFAKFEIVNPKFPFLVLQKNRVLKSLTLAKKFDFAKKSRFEIVNPSKIRDLKS